MTATGDGGRRALLVASALALAAAGCDWGMPRGDAARTGNVLETTIGVGNVADLEQAWTVDTGAAAPPAPVTAAGAVVVRDDDSLIGYDAVSGAVRWDTPLPGSGVFPPGSRTWEAPSANGTTVFAGFQDPITSGGSHGGMARFDARTGAVISAQDVGFVPLSAPSFVGDDVWVSIGAATPFPPLQGFSGIEGRLADGTIVRSIISTGNTMLLAGDPAVADGMAYFSRPGGGFLDAIDATGTEGCTPFGNFLNCAPLWSAKVSGSPSAAVSGSTVYTATPGDAGGIAAYATGREVRGPDQQPLWQASVPGASPVGVTPADVLVGSSDGTLRAYAADGCGAATCSPVWQGKTGGAVGAPVIANGVAYVTSADGHVYGFAAAGCGAATCDPLWSTATPGTPNKVIVANGRVFVTTATGDLVAYAVPA